MAERNWGMIQNGEVFEALVTAIIFFNDPTTILLGREGVDGGQDAKSGDGRIIYQAKFHKLGSAKQAIRDAKAECIKIEKYRSKENERYGQWKDAEEWVLVTNLTFNPSEDDEFNSQIVPMFAALGLKASYWERARLDIFLDLFVDVDNSYFGQNVRSFLSLGEAKLVLQEELGYLGRSEMPSFVGREREMDAFDDFLNSDSFFFAFHGAGGIGKTRLLYESGLLALQKMKWQVLWANVATMENTSAWFTTVIPEKPTLLLIDEPDSDKLLRLMMEQVGRKVGRTAGWKVAISVRSPKDPVLRFLSDAKNKSRVQFLPVKALPSESAIQLCEGLLRSGKLKSNSDAWLKRASIQIAQNFSSHPIWISIAVSVLERDGDLSQLPGATVDLMELYYGELILGLSPQVVSLINYVALIGVVNREQQDAIALICQETGLSLEELYSNLSVLIGRGLIVRRGANQRLYEIKPDVISDFIVRRWLVDSTDGISLSRNAKLLVDGLIEGVLGGNFSIVQRGFLSALVRTENVLVDAGVNISFLRPIYEGVKSALPNLDAKARLYAVEILTSIASFSPNYALLLSRFLRNDTAKPVRAPSLLRAVVLTQDEVVNSLGWFVYHAAIGADEPKLQKDILNEMLDLAVLESDILKKTAGAAANDGKRAKALLGRVLIGGPEYLNDYEVAAHNLIDELYARFVKFESQRDILEDVFSNLTAVRRHQSWFENNAFNTRIVFIQKGGVAWKTREKIISTARKLLESVEDMELCLSLWSILSNAHGAVNQCRLGESGKEFDFDSDLLDDLCWVESILTTKSELLTFNEIRAARKLWQWHAEYEEEGEICTRSKSLEALYIGTELASEFDQLFKFDVNYADQEKRIETKAIELAASDTVDEIIGFIDRAISYLGVNGNLNSLDTVAYNVGSFASDNAAVKEFISIYLNDTTNITYTRFASCIVQQVIRVRLSSSRSLGFELLLEAVGKCARDYEKVSIVRGCYSFASRNLESVLPREHDYLRGLFDIFEIAENPVDFFVTVGWGFSYDWDGYKEVIYNALLKAPANLRKNCLVTLFRSIYSRVRGNQGGGLPEGLNIWMFFLIQHLAYLEDDGQLDWLVKELFQVTGDVPLKELAQSLAFRWNVEVELGGEGFKAASYSGRLSQYVEKISDNNFSDESVRAAVAELIELMSISTGSLNHYFPDILHDIDPVGLVVPGMVLHKFEEELAKGETYNFRRVVRVYSVDSQAWRILARPVLEQANNEWPESDEQSLLYSLLVDHGVRSWSSVLGQVPQLFIDNVEKATRRLEDEKDDLFVKFYEWSLRNAQHELDRQVEQAKEERGE
ncbi:hypothetical protein EKG40_10925 [Pseudomonas moorei]|nr:hypothetical protein EKG40_10925 [Pseudomonas moorei]